MTLYTNENYSQVVMIVICGVGQAYYSLDINTLF